MSNPEDQPKPADAAANGTPAPSEPKHEPKAEASPSAAEAPADEPIRIEPHMLMLHDPNAAHDKPRKRLLPIAAGIAAAIAFGAIAGAAATGSLMREAGPSPAAVAAADTNRALRDSQARLESELSALKTQIATSQRTSSAQIGKLTERLERAEKAQAEPAAKIAEVAESLDRLERRLPTAAAPAAVAPAAGDITGSVAAKSDAKPPIADGWHVLDSYAGRAVVENRGGRIFEVGPGSNLPGLGRVEAVKRENGRVVVVTRNGVIAALPDPRRTRFMYED